MHLHEHHAHRQPTHGLPGHHYSFRVQVILNAPDRINTDYFRISYRTSWENFFDRVRMALCPDFVPEATDCIRDSTGAHVFDIDVLTHGEVLYFCPRGQPLRVDQPGTAGAQVGMQPPVATQNFIAPVQTGMQPPQQNFASVQTGMQPPQQNFAPGPGFTPGVDLRNSGGYNLPAGLNSVGLTLSFPDPDGAQPMVLPDPVMVHTAGAIYFPSPIPPDEEPPYIPEHQEERKALEDSGDVGNAGANVGGNTGLAVSNEQSKPEGEIEEEEKPAREGKEKETEKQEAKD